MRKYTMWILYMLSAFYIFTISACVGHEIATYDKEIEFLTEANDITENNTRKACEGFTPDDVIYDPADNTDCSEINEPISSYISEDCKYLTPNDMICNFAATDDYDDMDWGFVVSSSRFSEEERDKIKRAIEIITLYTHGYELDYGCVLSIVDEDSSRYWFATVFEVWISQFPEEREGWNIINEINNLKNIYNERSLSLLSFSLYPLLYFINEDNSFDVIVEFFQFCMNSGQDIGNSRYYFTFKKIDGSYKVIGLAVGR